MKLADTFVTFPEGGVERHFCDILGVCFTTTQPFGPIYRWQLDRPAKKDAGPSNGERNNQ